MPTMTAATFVGRKGFCSAQLLNSSQAASYIKLSGEEFMSKLLDRRWTLQNPDTKIHQIIVSPAQRQNGMGSFANVSFFNNTEPYLGNKMIDENQGPSFYILRDDLLHPLVNGNKARKLDALFPLIEDYSVTDVVTCGGCQSAHTAAVAVSCAERGLKSHLLLRGEQPEILTGYNLLSTMYGNVTYVPRSFYAHRKGMLQSHASSVAGNTGSIVHCNDIFEECFSMHTSERHLKKVIIVNEGASDAIAMLGIFRLLQYLSQDHLLGRKRTLNFIIDAGTGTTAIALGLGALCLGLPWKVTAVMLADKIDAYREQERRLISDFKRQFHFSLDDHKLNEVAVGIVHWVERCHERKFGNVLQGEIEACQQIAQQTGILVDPVYTLAAWEMAMLLSSKNAEDDADVVMLHTGGTLGLFGLAQRYKSYFRKLKDRLPASE
ncbi:hypothetical protein SLA2020_069580 [Shorea laevis]